MKPLTARFFLLLTASGLAALSLASSNNGTLSSPVHFAEAATAISARAVAAAGSGAGAGVLADKVSASGLDSAASQAAIPASSHVVLIVEENHSYGEVVGNSAMPYFNSLIKKYGLASKYYANTHPSIGNYFMLTTGQIITNDDSFCSTLAQDNMIRHLLTAGKTWKAYAESLPAAGYTGCGVYPYAKKHNPLAYFSDVADSNEKYNLVPFTRFASDLRNHVLPDFSYIVPDLLHDAHDGTLGAADAWLKTNIAPLISSATFHKDGILIIVFDESLDSDKQHGGGHAAALVIGPKVKPGYKSTSLYQHQNTLKTLMKALGLDSFPGDAGSAAGMIDFF
jgi:acid phosphatase